MRKTSVTFLLLCLILLLSCSKIHQYNDAKNYISFRNGEKISYSDYERLKKAASNSGLRRILQDDLEKIYKVESSEKEIIDTVLFNTEIKVSIEKPVNHDQTTAPKSR